MGSFGQTEHDVTNLFPKGKKFDYDGHTYQVIISGKPKPPRGECKTDAYIKAVDEDGNYREFKISIKQDNAEFLENKMSLERAKEIFGEDAQDIIRKSIATVKDNFLNDYLVYIEGARRTEPKCIKLGWKFELLRYDGGKRAGKIVLTREQKLNIYAGTELNEGKRNCWVGDSIIEDSGVANMYVEIGADEVSLKNVLSKMIPIEEFVDSQDSDLCFACKALNYRAVPDKWDGDRPLAVYVDWKLENRIMTGKIVLNQPLEHKGNEIGEKVQQILNQLGITEKNFSDIKNHLAPGTNVSE